MEAAIRSVQVGQRADAASSQPPASISYQQRIPSGASPIHRPVDTPQPYSKGPQPTPAASPQSYRVPAREAPIRYVQQNPYGTMQPFREAPYVRVPQVPQQVEYRSAPISVPANISISHGLPPTSTIETVANNASNRPRISLLPEDRRIPSEYLSNRPQQAAAPDPGGPPAFKKIRLTENHSQSPPPLLKVDVREPPTTGAYHPQVEAISPTPPNDPSEELRATKDELLQKITKVDMEINKAEKTIAMLKSKQASLEEVASKPAKAEEKQEVQPKHRSLAQKIYAENRKKANSAHEALSLLGPPVELPLYNQPSDVEICKEIIQRHQSFKSRLLLHLKKLKSERAARNQALAEKYSLLSQEWLRRVEKIESSAKRKAKEAKNREFFEKVFTELRKQREDKERFNRVGSRIKSEADVEEIIDGLQEQANEDKKMRSYAVIPPLMLDAKQKRYVFHNENGALTDMENDFKDRKNLNVWTTGEKEIFKEKFLQHPKNFGAIAASLDRKSAQDCVRYYYLSKKTENYKQLLRKSRQRTRSSRNPNKSNHTQSQCIVDAMTTGVTTRLQREQQQKTGARATNSANITPPQATTGSITPPNSLPSQFTSQVRCSQAESTSTSTTTIDSTNNAADTSTTAPTTTNNVNESETVSVSTKAGDSDSSVKSTNIDTDKNDESFREKTDGTASNPTNSDSSNALPADGTVASTNNSGNQPQTTNSTPTTSSASNINCTSIVNTVNGLKTDIVTSLANKTTALSVVPSKENVSHSNSVNQPSTATVTVTATTAAITTNTSSTPTENDIAKLDNNKKAVDTSVSSAVNTVASNANEEDEKLEESEAKKRRKETSESTEDDATTDIKDKLHPCFVCKEENCVRTRPLEKGRGQQYGISDDTISAGARVCNTCQCKSVRNRYPSCPLPTCPNPKDRVTRFRNFPARLFELAADIRDPIIQEFQIPANVTKCCSACLIKIKRKLGPHLLGTNLTDEEITKLKTLLQDVGPKWSQLAESLGKTAVALRSFCFHYKKKYSFDLAVNEYYKSHPSEERRTAITDGDESDLSTSSCDENEGGSDTASVESPKATSNNQTLSSSSSTSSSSSSSSSSNVNVKKEENTTEPPTSATNADDRLLPPVAQPPRKQKVEEYDSSATETADEENETSPGNRNSPKVLLYQNQTTITMVPSTVQNGPRDSINREITNVRDVMLDVIERSLKTGQQPPPPKPSIVKQNVLDSRGDITFDIHYRNDIGKPHHISSMANVTQPAALSRSSNQEGLATLSVVNSHGHPQQVLSHPHSISNQIAATITPVQNQTSSSSTSSLSSSSSSNQNQSSSVPKSTVHDVQKDISSVVVYPRTEEPQTLDLSIKKPARDNFPPPAHSKPIPGNSVTMYRSDPHAHVQTPPSIVNPNTNYMMYDPNRPSKSPSMFMPNVPTSMPMSQQPQHSIQNLRVHQNPSMHSQVSQQSSISQSKVKTAPKLSPKVTQHQSNNQQSGHKGSITHGTPVNSNNQQILIQSPATLSPRFDGILRQTPPSGDKLGSITQGTPVHLPPHHLTDKARVYDYYKNRQSPAQPPQQPSPQATTFGSPYAQGRPPGPYTIEQQAQLSSRQIIMNDFITSQQMHGQQVRGRSEKESPSPRSTGVPGSPAQLYYAEKEQQRQRAEYLSRASPADHSTPSPHRTPPPQRQGVIQRHNTGGSKPPSPAPNRLHIMSQHHYAMPGHEAFSSLVDVAVQQPLLPVPHKEEKRPKVPVSEPAQHHEIRYHPHLAAAHEQMAMMHQQQQQIRVEMQRRHMQQQERERVDRERERERVDRERERERHHQDRLDRERREEQFRQRGDRWKSPERERAERDRERERIVMEEQELERRRMANAVAHPFIRDGQNIPRDGRPGRQADGSLTAASLIDAIITHQINQNASEPPVMRDGHRPPFFPGRDLHPENNGKPHSLNVINIDSDSDRRNPILTKNITLGELTDSIIAKDYSPNPFLPLRQTAFMQYRPDQTEIWKMNHRLTQKDGIPVPQSQPQQLPPPVLHNQSKSSSNSKVSMHENLVNARSASPRTTKAYHESITPPENYHYAAASAAHSRIPSQQSSGHQFALDCYVKNRIVEAMRTEESDKRSDEIPEQQRRTPQERPTPSSSVHHSKEHDRSSTPGEMVIDEESSQARPASGTAERKESWPSFTPSTYAYPFSALNVSGAASNLPPPMKTAHGESDSGGRSQQQAQEPKPLLSAQYEALSDED